MKVKTKTIQKKEMTGKKLQNQMIINILRMVKDDIISIRQGQDAMKKEQKINKKF